MLRHVFLLLIVLTSVPSLARQSCEWPFRTQINVQENSSSGSQLTNYQVKFEIDAADLSPDYNWSSNGQDLTVYDTDDSTELAFWIDNWDSGAKTATIFVYLPTLAIGQTRTIYFYYGNENADNAGGTGNTGNTGNTFTYPGIKFHTRTTTTNPNNLVTARNAFNLADDTVPGYGCTFVTNFTGITNRSQNDPTTQYGYSNKNFAAFSESYFYADEAGSWQFRYGADFGRGGALYVDNVELEQQWTDDLWWATNWGNGSSGNNNENEILRGSITLTQGYHKLEVLGFEGGNDGGITVQFKKPSAAAAYNQGWQTFSTGNITVKSRACPLAVEPTFTVIAHDVCHIDLGFDSSLSYPSAWVENDSRPVTFAIENLSTSHPSLPDTRVAIILGSGLSISSSLGNSWNCSILSTSSSSTEMDCLYALAINPNGTSSSQLTLNIVSTSANSSADFSATVFSKQFESQLVNNQTSTTLPVWQLTDDVIPNCSIPYSGVFSRFYNSQGYGDNYADSEVEFDIWENDLAVRAKLDGQTVLSQINHNPGNPFGLRSNEYYLTLIEGYLYAPEDGFYNLAVDGDDAVELKINDTVYSSWYGGHGKQNSPYNENTWGLSKGYHKLNFRMQEYTGGDSFYAYWRKPSETITTIIPPSAFFHCAGVADIRLSMTVNMQDNPNTVTTNDFAIPGAILRYKLQVSNEGNLSTNGNDMELIQTLSDDAKLYVNNLSANGPVLFSNGSGNNISGLSYNFISLGDNSDNLSFSNNNGTSYSYTPTADSEGYDSNITHIKLIFTGSMMPKYDQGTPEFNIEYQIKVK